MHDDSNFPNKDGYILYTYILTGDIYIQRYISRYHTQKSFLMLMKIFGQKKKDSCKYFILESFQKQL